MVYSRSESIMTTTKRHPSRIRAGSALTRDGKLAAMDFTGDFNTGAYSSWGPTVANRVPVHASGPYYVPALPGPDPRGAHPSGAGRRLPRLRRAPGRGGAWSSSMTSWPTGWASIGWSSASPTPCGPTSRP